MSDPAATTINGESVLLLPTEPTWEDKVRLQLTLRSDVVRTLSGRALLYQLDHAPRWQLSLSYDIDHDTAAAWRTGLREDPDRRVAIPLWPHYGLSDAYAARWVDAANWWRADTGAIVAAGSVSGLPSGTYVAPVLIGRITRRPSLKALEPWLGTFALEIEEEGPIAGAITLVDQSLSSASWPTALEPAWTQIVEQIEVQVDTDALGQGREPVLIGVEAPAAFSQEAEFALEPADAAVLADFFRLQGGRAGVFTAPAWFTPGTVSTYNPIGYSARFGGEELALDFYEPNLAEAKVKLVEVPVPGDTATAAQPVYLYRLRYDVPASAGGPLDETITSHEAQITYGSQDYLPGRIEHGSIEQTWEFGRVSVDLRCALGDSAHLLRQWRREHEAPLTLEIFEAYPSGSPSPVPIFSGRVGAVSLQDRVFQAEAGDLPSADFPRLRVQRADNLAPWSALQGSDPADYAVSATVYDLSGHQLRVTFASDSYAADYFAWGWLAIGTGADYQRRVIVWQAKTAGDPARTLKLDRPLRGTISPGASLTLYPGYNGDWTAAKSLFTTDSAYLNFIGFPYVPDHAPEIPANFKTAIKK